MINLYFWPTPNGNKITIMLEECGLDYTIYPIDITTGHQFQPEFLKLSPNNRMPAIVDDDPSGGGAPIDLFESGAILLYLAEKTGLFLPDDLRERYYVMKWLMWQMGGLGPMAGQCHHFNRFAPEKIPYAIDRYKNETRRLYAVLNKALENRNFIVASYSIADIAIYPWIARYEWQGMDLNDHPNVKRWFECIQSRPETKRAYERGEAIRNP